MSFKPEYFLSFPGPQNLTPMTYNPSVLGAMDIMDLSLQLNRLVNASRTTQDLIPRLADGFYLLLSSISVSMSLVAAGASVIGHGRFQATLTSSWKYSAFDIKGD